jgi:hypothetical protein
MRYLYHALFYKIHNASHKLYITVYLFPFLWLALIHSSYCHVRDAKILNNVVDAICKLKMSS